MELPSWPRGVPRHLALAQATAASGTWGAPFVRERTALRRPDIVNGFAKNPSALTPVITEGELPLIKRMGIDAVSELRFNCRTTVAPEIPGRKKSLITSEG